MKYISRNGSDQKGALRLIIVAALVVTFCSKAIAQQSEYPVKAAFLVNFLKFIDWPDKSGPYIIEVAGKSPFGTYLESLASNRTINGRKIVIRSDKHGSGPPASIVFVPSSESERYADYLQYAKKPVIVIGETAGFAQKYGAINFIFEHDRVGFEINPKMAKNSGVKVSSRLLQLAKIVD